MITESELPHTEQGMLDYIRFGEDELKRNDRRNKKLNEMIAECWTRLTILGWVYQNHQWKKNLTNKNQSKGNQNAQHLQAV